MKILRDIIIPLLYVAAACTVCLPLLDHRDELPDIIHPKHSAENEPSGEILARGEYIISPYDAILRRVGAEYGIDWRLLSALAFVESRFTPNARSKMGALGLMQVMPHVAREYGVEREQLLDPAVNADVAARLIVSIQRMIRASRIEDPHDRLALMLACYNCGYGHLTDARALADYFGADRDSWEDVSVYMELLSDPDFYNHEEVTYGRWNGSDETIAHVEQVIKRYERYCRKAPEA